MKIWDSVYIYIFPFNIFSQNRDYCCSISMTIWCKRLIVTLCYCTEEGPGGGGKARMDGKFVQAVEVHRVNGCSKNGTNMTHSSLHSFSLHYSHLLCPILPKPFPQKNNKCTAGIQKLDMSGFWMVDMAILKPDHSKTGHFLVQTILFIHKNNLCKTV